MGSSLLICSYVGTQVHVGLHANVCMWRGGIGQFGVSIRTAIYFNILFYFCVYEYVTCMDACFHMFAWCL